MKSFEELKKRADEIIQDYEANTNQLKLEKKAKSNTEQNLQDTQLAQKIAQEVAQKIQQSAHTKITKIVSECLRLVFPDEFYGFKIRFEQKRGKTEATLLLLNDGHEVEKPLQYDSGGVLDVASFALRLSTLLLSKPYQRRVLVMDEPFKNVSLEYRDNVREMLLQLAERFSIQFIMVTHETGLKCGAVVSL